MEQAPRLSRRQLTAWNFGCSAAQGTSYLGYGSIRSGKTYALSLGFGAWTQSRNRPLHHLIIARKLAQVRDEIVPTLRAQAVAHGLAHRYNRSLHELAIGRQRYSLMAVNDKKSKDRLVGLTIHSILGDEATLWEPDFLPFAEGRLSYPDSKIFLGCNPQGPLHPVKKLIDAGHFDHVERFLLRDNPWLSRAVVERYERSFPPSSSFYRRYILGQWAAADGVIWPAWHTAPVVEQAGQRVLIGIDVGVANSNSGFVALVQQSTTTPNRWAVAHASQLLAAAHSATGEGPTLAALVEHTRQLCNRFAGHPIGLVVDSASVGHHFYQALQQGAIAGVQVYAADKTSVESGLQEVAHRLHTGDLFLGEETQLLADEMASYVWLADRDKPDYTTGTFDLCDALRYATTQAFIAPDGLLHWKY